MSVDQIPNAGLLEYEEVVADNKPATTTPRSWYHWLLLTAAILFAAVSVGFVGTIFWSSFPTWAHHGFTLLTGKGWVSPNGPFGGLAMITGTLETSLIALIIAVIIGLGTAISIVFFIPRRFRTVVATLVELLAAIPSVVYWPLGPAGHRAVDGSHGQPMAQQLALRQRDLWQSRPGVRHVAAARFDRAGHHRFFPPSSRLAARLSPSCPKTSWKRASRWARLVGR